MNFTATIEQGELTFDIHVCIDEDGANVYAVSMGDTRLTKEQLIYFIRAYGAADLEDEAMMQYTREQDAIRLDEVIENFKYGRKV